MLHDTTEPIMTPRAEEGVFHGYGDVTAGRGMSISEAKDRLGVKDESEA